MKMETPIPGNDLKDQALPEGRPGPPETNSEAFWKVVGVSTAGTTHTRLDLPCQDSNLFEISPSGALVAVVADGAGSAVHAELGSQLAVTTVINEARC
jgi:hypothetical protein